MKRNLCILVLVFLFGTSAKAQMFEEGDKVVNLGIGFGSTFYTSSLHSMVIPPLSASFEMGIKDGVLEEGSIGVGGYVGFSRYKWEYFDWGYNLTNFILGGRGVFHYPLIDDLDTYAGALFGFRIVTDNEFGTPGGGYNYNDTSGGLVLSFYVGGRYYFADNLAAMMELGYGISYINLGIAFKLD